MNFKELVSALAREAGVSGGGGINTVRSATGETARLVQWVKAADLDLQGLYFDWKFLWRPFDLTTEAGKGVYNAPLEWHWWDRDKVRVNGQRGAEVLEYELWDGLDDGLTSQPYQIIVLPDGNLKLYPTPDKAYQVTLPFYRKPQAMTVDTDESLIPEPFHDLIWMWALVKYAHYEAAPEVMERVQVEYPQRLRALESHQLPGRHRYMLAQDSDPIVVRPE